MRYSERALIELQNWATAHKSGLSIHFTGHNPTIINNIPHAWSCEIGAIGTPDYFCGYGVIQDTAILDCFYKWQKNSGVMIRTADPEAITATINHVKIFHENDVAYSFEGYGDPGWGKHEYFWKWLPTGEIGSKFVYCHPSGLPRIIEFWNLHSSKWAYSLTPFQIE